MQFEYPEDREFFANLLTDGDDKRLEEEFSDYFDFRHPAIKRWEFNKSKKKLLKELVETHGGHCQLRIHPDCSKDGIFEPDHIIPLSSNELNKKLRYVERTSKEKVLAQSFGSNHRKNLTLACKRCNAFKKHRIILPKSFLKKDTLDFLRPHKVEDEIFTLSSGEHVSIQKYFLHFNLWKGTPISNTYNGKAVIDWNGEPVFAELAVLRMFQSQGWDGVWVDSYRRKYRTGLPDVVEPIDIPEKQKQLIEDIRKKTGKHGGCWDVFVWKDDRVFFVELKRQKKDAVQDSQRLWLEKSLESRLTVDNFAFLEWVTQ